jgi:hypothetical protein
VEGVVKSERIAELRALAEKATPGPWQRNGVRKRVLDEDSIVVATVDGKGWAFIPIGKDEPGAIADAAFIAAARTALPEALDELALMATVFRAIDKQPLMRGMVYNWIHDDPNCAISQMDFEAAMHAALEGKAE